MHAQAENVMVVGDPRHVGPKWRPGAEISPFPMRPAVASGSGTPSVIGTSGTYDSRITCDNIASGASDGRKVVRNSSFRSTTRPEPR